MDWTVIRDAATGRANALNRVVRRSSDECAALGTLLLLEETPHPAAAPVAAARSPNEIAPLVRAALAPLVAPAAWRADPHCRNGAGDATTVARLTRGSPTWSARCGIVPSPCATPQPWSCAMALSTPSDVSSPRAAPPAGGGWRTISAALPACDAPADLGRVWAARGPGAARGDGAAGGRFVRAPPRGSSAPPAPPHGERPTRRCGSA